MFKNENAMVFITMKGVGVPSFKKRRDLGKFSQIKAADLLKVFHQVCKRVCTAEKHDLLKCAERVSRCQAINYSNDKTPIFILKSEAMKAQGAHLSKWRIKASLQLMMSAVLLCLESSMV